MQADETTGTCLFNQFCCFLEFLFTVLYCSASFIVGHLPRLIEVWRNGRCCNAQCAQSYNNERNCVYEINGPVVHPKNFKRLCMGTKYPHIQYQIFSTIGCGLLQELYSNSS